MTTSRNYTPLTRRAYGPAGRYRLYLGADHLLHVHEEFLAERYQRFYFRDIQAISVQRTSTRDVIGLFHVFALVGLGLLWTLLFTFDAPLPPLVIFGVLFGLLFASLISNYYRGPSCACLLQTAVGTEQIYAINRFRTAGKALATLQPLIEATQGTFNPDDLQQLPPVLAPLVPTAKPPPPVPVTRTQKHCTGRAHWVLAALLAVDIVGSFADLYHPMTGFIETAYGMLMLFGVIAALIAALITQTGSDLPRRIKMLTWTTLVFIVVVVAGAIIATTVWGDIHEHQVDYWANIYSVIGDTLLCIGFWRGLRGWR